ncbi:MAG: HAMP domain-containing histidine kinase [bacterium]|nr:HAMP domain-containing histidine kinase [bacterium]
MIAKTPALSGQPLPAHLRREHRATIVRIALVSVVVSEIITIALTRILLGEILEEGMLIALICAAPISALLADRQLRMRYLIENQRDQLSVLNGELSARNSDLDAFARTVAHDLKNPLTTIIGMTDLLASDPDPAQTEQTSEFLAAIAQSGDLAIEIIDGLLLLHGIQNESQELVAVDTRETVTSALETLASDIERNAAVVSKSGPLLPVKAHAPWLAQVWINLISNALKYGGSPPAVDLVSQAMPDSMVRFEVTDNGDGIAPEDRERIFTEFERADDTSAPGHGIGLAIVTRVIDRLGGEIGVDKAPSGGSTFWFTVPAA